MAWALNDVRTVLNAAGLGEDKPSFLSLSTSFTGPQHGNWLLYAHVSHDGSNVKDVVFGIHPVGDPIRMIRGTKHRVSSHDALVREVNGILNNLVTLAANEAQLKCPKCKLRWVHPKEPTVTSYKQFNPFLSCDGMVKARRGAANDVACDGVSKAMAAVVTYR